MKFSTRAALFLTVGAVSTALMASATARRRLARELRKRAGQARRSVSPILQGRCAPVPEALPEPRPEAPREPAQERAPAPPVTEGALLEQSAEKGLRLEELEKAYILQVLDRVKGNQTRAAEILGIARRTLYRKLRGYGVSSEDPE